MADSALIGQPPNTPRDLNIIKGLYRQYGLASADATKGWLMAPKRPDGVPDGENKQAGLIAGMIIVILAIVIPTYARLHVRLGGNQTRFGLDDVAIIVAASLAVSYPCINLAMIAQAQGGTHTWERTYEDYQTLYYYLYLLKVLFYVTVGVIKVSITLFIRRLTREASHKWRIFADVFLVTLFAYIMVALFWNLFNCNPPRIAWDKQWSGSLETPGTCGDLVLNARVVSVMHVVQGIILLTSPVIILWKVRMDLTKKIRLFIIWLVGGWSVIGGLLAQINPPQNPDVFYHYDAVLVWTVLDLTMGIIAASLPVLDVAIAKWLTKARSRIATISPIGNSSNTRSRTAAAEDSSHHGWTNDHLRVKGASMTSKVERSPRKDDSESVENMIREEGTELGIMRTDEVRLSYELQIGKSGSTSKDSL